MTAKRTRLSEALARTLAAAAVALAICLGAAGCADINIDASKFKIPGLTTDRRNDDQARADRPADTSGATAAAFAAVHPGPDRTADPDS